MTHVIKVHDTSEVVDKLEQDYIALTEAMDKEELKEHRAQFKERGNPFQHLKSAAMDWRTEGQWERDNEKSIVVSIDDTTFGYFTFTTKAPRHCTIRHIFSLPGATPGAASYMLETWLPEYAKSIGVDRLRFWADAKAIGYYEKLGYDWWGWNQAGKMPYYYGDFDKNRIVPPKADHKRIGEWINDPFPPSDLFEW